MVENSKGKSHVCSFIRGRGSNSDYLVIKVAGHKNGGRGFKSQYFSK